MCPTLLPDTPVQSLDDYIALGGGAGMENARRAGPSGTIDEVVEAGLRGRGGGGFPTGTKWRSVLSSGGTHRYLVCNAAEGEPGTYKDRAILRYNPYQVVEGVAIAAFALEAREAYIGIKAAFTREVHSLRVALAEMAAAEILGDVPITLVEGPDEYLFGEEKALLEVIEGEAPLPRILPPHQHGLFAQVPQLGWSATGPGAGHRPLHAANPTAVNNVETLAHVSHILANGSTWFRSRGTRGSPGTMVFTVSGDVELPSVYELEMGTPLSVLVHEFGGGVRAGRSVRMVISGVANPVITPDMLGTPMDFDEMEAAGTGLGSGGFVVYDDTACAVALARTCSRFLYVESCGQCPACKLGTGEITAALERIEVAAGGSRDVELVHERLLTVTDGNRCYLPIEEVRLIESLLNAFPEDIERHLDGSCERRHDLPVPKILGFDDDSGRFLFDERQELKRPDWTYAE